MRGNSRHFCCYVLGLSVVVAMSSELLASVQAEMQAVLAQGKPPDGVLFEIVEADADFLKWAIPEIKQHIDRLRAKFPHLDVAVVTHGREQFALMRKTSDRNHDLYERVKSLVKDDKIALHVCGTHANWRQVESSEFIDGIDVASAGPAQINDYKALGYVVIRIKK